MSSTETITYALLRNGNADGEALPFFQNINKVAKTGGKPSWLESYRYFFLGSWLNIMLVFVPLSIISHHLEWDAALRFSFGFLAIIPLAKLLGEATDQLSVKLGQTLAGLVNASFGNAIEIIVGIAALLQDQLVIVQTSMLGSILSNILLVLGCSFLAGGLKFSEVKFQVQGARAAASLMTLACITLVIPTAYASTTDTGIMRQTACLVRDDSCPKNGLLFISRGTAILLFLTYAAYLIFQLKTHSHYFQADREDEDEEEEAQMSTLSAGSALLLVTIVTSFCADYLVASIEETAHRYDIPKPFIGLILLPIVTNAADHVTAVWMAMKAKMEITIGICVGSSIQIATFIIPLLVVVGWITGHQLTLQFANFEIIALFVSVFLVTLLITDGKSNYMEGLMLIILYFAIALAFWVQ